MNNFRDTYLKLKSGVQLTKEDIAAIRAAVFGRSEVLSDYAILSFGLSEPKTTRNLGRLKELAEVYINQRDDDLLKACLTAGCIYFNSPQYFVDISQKVLEEEDMYLFEDSSFVAGTCISKQARMERSIELLSALTMYAKKSLDKDEMILCESLTRSALESATGSKCITSKEVKQFMDHAKLDSIEFDMNI
ncbi:hypothetical protein SAMN05444141_1143 [Pseudovibrio denitrificans]|uniref:Uncharacterized protein n=1 Tax=Pseudovibrio denitrificans TaxID=258256 RepID=A0A1I7DZ58_9HYPH|nr:hypothetical protein [Pseudovibrio denitrificans]SFU16967.1 hypothetical protein SAMN05444141_1143 [Pseudovibrio denitrificans]